MESYWGSMDRAYDVTTVICDAPVIWWPRGRGCVGGGVGVGGLGGMDAMRGMDLKRVYFRNDIVTHIAWLTRNEKHGNFSKQIWSYSRNKKYLTVS